MGLNYCSTNYYTNIPGWVIMVSALVYSFILLLSLPGRKVPVGLHCSSVAVSVLMAFSSLLRFRSCCERSMGFSLQDWYRCNMCQLSDSLLFAKLLDIYCTNQTLKYCPNSIEFRNIVVTNKTVL